ncbi:MAG: leucine-rich repeat domain-containing protein [Acidobacteria bacterium]|nr:leucine-rich repeat domain-containing protein [Acidobacteriota bacterium]
MSWPPKILLTLLAFLTGCSRAPSFRDVQKGKIPLEETQRRAVEALLEQADLPARKLFLGKGEDNSLVVEGGAVRALRLTARLTDPSPLAGLVDLRELRLFAARFPDLSGFGEHPQLDRLSLTLGSRIGSLKGLGAQPSLLHLSVRGPLESLVPLAGSPALEELYVHDAELADLQSLPSLPRLRLFSLGPARIETFAGLEAAPGLEELIVTDLSRLEALTGLPPLQELRKLSVFHGRLGSLEGLPPLPSLMELRIEDSPLESLCALPEDPSALPKLEVLQARCNRLGGTVRLPFLPSLRRLTLAENKIEGLDLPALPALETLDLANNRLASLEGLGAAPRLTSMDVSNNPVAELSPLLALPALRRADIQHTEVGEIPKSLYERSVYLAMDPALVEANRWEKVLRESWDEEGFLDRLPGGRGRIEGSKISCRWSAGTFRSPRLSCTVSASSLKGFLYLSLVEVDPLFPTSGGPNEIRIRATLSIEEGVARIYLRDRIDFRGTAEALAGYRDCSKPLLSIGDSRDPADYRDGYRLAEARPGQPVTLSGEAGIFVDQVIVWLEGVEEATGLRLEIEPS